MNEIKYLSHDDYVELQADPNNANVQPLKVARFQQEALTEFLTGNKTLHLYAGGRESGKSNLFYHELEMICRGYLGKWKANILLVRTTKESAKKTILQGTIGKVLSNMGINYEELKQKSFDRGTITINGHLIRIDSFTADQSSKEKLKGYEGVTHVFVEELAELQDFAMFDQLYKTVNRRVELNYIDTEWNEEQQQYVQLKKKYSTKGKIFCAFNTPEINHWILNSFYSLKETNKEGFFSIEPKTGAIPDNEFGLTYEDRPIYYSFSTVYDNSAYEEKMIEDLGEKGWQIHLLDNHEIWKNIDPYYYNTSTLGLVGSGRSGKVFKDWKEITLEDYMKVESDMDKFYGVDFGFADDYSSVCEIKYVKSTEPGQRNKLYVKPIVYERGLLASTLGAKIKGEVPEFGTAEFFADHRPEAITELEQMGIFNITKARKGNASRTPQVSYLLSFDIYYVEIEVDYKNGNIGKAVAKELAGYHWLQNKSGESMNEPSDGNDHFLDCFRYGVFTKLHPDNQTFASNLYSVDSVLMQAFADNLF